jgi:hypothetical protein
VDRTARTAGDIAEERRMTDSAGDTADSRPNSDLRTLDPLAGTWTLSGDTIGTVTYEWLPGGFFLLQRYDMVLHGHPVTGIEVIGHVRPFGQEPSREIRSRAYDNTGNTLDYVYKVDQHTLTIWAGEVGPPAYYRGEFSSDGRMNSGAWVYPDGGGYHSTMTRTERP